MVFRFTLFTLLFFSLILKAQSSSGDLVGATKILVNRHYTFEKSPIGFGNIQEFPRSNKRSAYYFKEERNSIWFLIEIPFSGMLDLDIIPDSPRDDYDWMLFNATPDLNELLESGRAQLLRSNNSRNDEFIKGKTGLKEGYSNLYEELGPGKSYSKSVEVKGGQKLALLIDNIYDAGSGFKFISWLRPAVSETRVLTGTVRDKNTHAPIPAQIICEDDSTGAEMMRTLAGADGAYSMAIPADRAVNIVVQYSGYIFQTEDIEKEDSRAVIDFALAPATEADKLILYNIHFTPDRDIISAASEPELLRLVSILQQQKAWEIKIIGHTNNNPFADARYLQKLSFNRAVAVKKYFTAGGIEAKRITCIGVGGKSPLVITKDPVEGLRNLRVEIAFDKH